MAGPEKENQTFEPVDGLKGDTKSGDVQNTTNFKLEQNFKDGDLKEKLDGGTIAILNDLRENHIKIEGAEMMGYKGKNVHIELPPYRNFRGFNFDYFVSDDTITKGNLEKKFKLKNKSYSMSDVSKLLQAMNEYITEHKGTNDGDMNYGDELKYWETEKYRCNAGDCLKAITGLDYFYWLSDKDLGGEKNSRVRWFCYSFNCHFDLYDDDSNVANLFLKLSD